MPKPAFQMPAAQYRGEGTEAQWRATVKECAAHYGWQVLLEIPDKGYEAIAKKGRDDPRLIPTMAALRGWPDLLLGHTGFGVTIAVELKTPTGRLSPYQVMKLDLLDRCGIPCFVWVTGTDEMDTVLRDPTQVALLGMVFTR